MAVSKPKSGVTELTATTGTGPLTLTGAAAGFRGFVSADDGLSYPYAIYQAGTAFETGIGIYSHAGRQLSRTTILANIAGTTVPLNLGSGTKEVSIVIPGERVMMSDSENQFLADQFLNGQRLYLDTAQTSWIDIATAGVFRLYIDSTVVWQGSGNLGNLTLIGSNDTATEGPELTLRRDSATAAASDALFVIRGQGKDASGATQSSFKMASRWTSVTAGGHASTLDLSIASGGALQTVMTLAPSRVTIPSGVNTFTVGKTTTSPTVVGAELFSDGSVSATTNNTTPFFACRNGSDGALVTFVKSGTTINSISILAGDIQYLGFTGVHRCEWAPGQGGVEFETFGTVVSTAEGTLPSPGRTPLVMVQPACGPNDPRVFGIISGRELAVIGDLGKRSLLSIHAIGDSMIRVRGAVAGGDLLWASTTPGVAETQPDDIVRSTTVAKAIQDSPDDGGERLVPCVLMAG